MSQGSPEKHKQRETTEGQRTDGRREVGSVHEWMGGGMDGWTDGWNWLRLTEAVSELPNHDHCL